MPELSYREAVRDALATAMRADDDVFLMGEDIAEMGGSMGVTQGLLDEFGAERVRNTPISEIAIVGAGIGAAMQGMRPVVEIMYEDFLTLSMEQIVNQAAKHRYMSGGQLKVPLTIRTQGGAGWSPGAQHAQQLEAWLVHVPGLKVVFPSSPTDVRGLLWSSIYDDNPVIFFEHRLLYPVKEEVPEKLEPIPLGKARVVREGTDVTVIATGPLVHRSLAAAKDAEAEGISVEVVDPRTLQPLDEETLVESVKKTNRAVVAHEAVTRMGFGAEVAAVLQEQAFDWLDAPIERVGAKFAPLAFAPAMEQFVDPAARGRARRDQAHRRDAERGDEVKLPRLGQGMEMGTIVRWLKSEGDPVAEGRAALRARHRQGDAGGRGRGERRAARRSRSQSGEVPVGQTVAVIGQAGRDGRRSADARPRRRSAVTSRDDVHSRRDAAPRRRRRSRQRCRRRDERVTARRRPAAGSRPRRSRGGSRASAGSSSRRSPAPGPTAGSSPRTSSAPSAAPAPRRRARADRRPARSSRSRSRASAGRSPAGSPPRGRCPPSSSSSPPT